MNGLSGRIEAGEHLFPVRIYYEDTDAAGLVYHANYLKYAKRARTEMLRLVGINQSEFAARHGITFSLRECTLDYRRPARLDDLVEVRSRLIDLRAATVHAEQVIACHNSELARIRARVACVRSDGRPARVPSSLRDALAPYFQRKGQV